MRSLESLKHGEVFEVALEDEDLHQYCEGFATPKNLALEKVIAIAVYSHEKEVTICFSV